MNEDINSILRKPAKSGKIDYAEPVIIHETTKSRITVIPYFIPHSDHTELAIKIQTYKKGKPPFEWMLADDKSISLQENPCRKLISVLTSHLKVSQENDNGQYLLIKVKEGVAEIGQHDPSAIASALTKVLSQGEIVNHLQGSDISEELMTAFRSAIKLKEMNAAVSELRQHIESGNNEESVYQKWCEKHPWSFGNAYLVNQEDVRNISNHDNLDIVLSNVIAGYRDIVELKRPDMDVIYFDSAHRNYYFSSDVSKAIGQCHRYIDVFQEVASKGLRDHPEMVAYYPKATIVIGRSFDWSEEKQKGLYGLNNRLSGIKIMTYDHLLLQGERLVQMLNRAKDENNEIFEEPEDIF